MKTRDQIIADNPIETYLQSRGVQLIGSGVERSAKCPFHQDKNPSFGVNIKKQTWISRSGCGGGSIIDLIARFEGISDKAVMKRLGEVPDNFNPPQRKEQTEHQEQEQNGKERPVIVKAYDYRNAKGDLVYQALRLNPKSFRQRRPGSSEGKWIWNMENVERVLYRLPMILKTQKPIVICEGEKDCDSLVELGMVATTNVGGAGKWLDAYSDILKGKEIILCGDNDKPGKEHMDKVLESLAGKAKTVTVVRVPEPFKDVSEWLETMADKTAEDKFNAFQKLVDESPVFDKGLNIPVQSMAELEIEFRQSVKRSQTHSLDLSRWLPSLKTVRPLIAGELLALIAGTGVGKTALASNLAFHAAPMKTLFFQQELPGSLMFERSVAMGTKTAAIDIYKTYVRNERVDWQSSKNLDHIFTCTKTRLTAQKIEDIIRQSELKIGERPALVVVDYIQLMGGDSDRRVKVADAAEGLKVVAKNTNTVIVMISQIKRKGMDMGVEVTLEDGKEAGEIENSSGLLIGAWRDENDAGLLHLKVLKNTKGFSGKEVLCNFDGETMTITERAETEAPEQPEQNETKSPYKED